MKRIPKALVGKPRLCKAWLWKKENPSASSYEMGKHASYRPQDGWRIEKEFEKLDVNEENIALVHPNLTLNDKSAILIYNSLLEMDYKYGLPFLITSKELSERLSISQSSVYTNMKKLFENGVVNYSGTPSGMIIEIIDYPLHAV